MWLKSPICAWNSLWHLGQTRFVRRDASGWVIVDSVLVKLYFILGFLDSIWLRCNSTIHNDVPPDVSFLSQDFTVIHFNVEPFQWCFKGVLHLWALFLKTFCIFSKNKAILDKETFGSGQKCSKEFTNHSFTSVEVIVVKLQWKMCRNQYFTCFEP